MSRGSELALAIVAAIVAITAAATAVEAQPAGQAAAAAATAQFDLGRALMKQENYAEACAAFERSQKLDAQWGTLYNLATCYAQIGKVASAWAAYRELAQRDPNPGRRKDSGQKARSLESRLPRLLITAPSPPQGLVVTVDGVDVTPLLGIDNPIDLGRHVIRATAPGRADLERARTIVDEGRTVKLSLTLVPGERGKPPASDPVEPVEPAPEPVKPLPTPRTVAETPSPTGSPAEPTEATGATAESPADAPPGSRRRLYGVLIAGGGAAVIVTGLVFGQLANSTWSDAKQLCGDDLTCDNPDDLVRGNRLVAEARTRANVSTALVIGGAVAAGAGVVLYLTAPRRDAAAQTALRISPVAGPGSVSLRVDGRF